MFFCWLKESFNICKRYLVYCWYLSLYKREIKWYRFYCGLPFGALGIIHRYSGFILRTLHIVGFVWLFGFWNGRDGRAGETGGSVSSDGRAGVQLGGQTVGRSVGRMDDIYDIYIKVYIHTYIRNIYIYS